MRFGTDGVRGTAGEEPITVEGGLLVGRAAALLADHERVAVGRDPRASSSALAASVLAGVAAQGGQAVDLGVVPTSAVGVYLAEGLAAAGVMITASHNPAPDNGFKVLDAGGRKLSGERASQVEGWLAAPPAATAFGTVEPGEALHLWRCRAEAVLPPLPEQSLVVDLANGASTVLAGWLRQIWPGPLHVVGSGGVPNQGVGSEHLGHLGEAVRSHGAWAGLAVDGDGDRCRLVGPDGEAIPGDAVTWWLARSMGVPAVAVTVMSNGALEAQLPGVDVVRTPVGDKHIAAAMRREGLALGAEESGHVLFADFPAGDGIVAGLRALAAIGTASLPQTVGQFRPLPRRLGKLRVGSRPPLDEVAALREPQADWSKRLGTGGRVFLRYSGTEPVLRILVEGGDVGVVQQVYGEVEAIAREALP